MVPPPLRLEPIGDPTLSPLAGREVQSLSEAVKRAPKQAQLLMHMLNRREAVDSSQIEGTHTELDGLLLHELQVGTPDAVQDDDAEQTLNYVRAYAIGAKAVQGRGRKAFTASLIPRLHRQLMAGDAKASPGRYRIHQNFIGGPRIEHARFIPPPASEVPRLMTDLERALRYESDPESHYVIGVQARALLVHPQFEAIHPFRDGNGRTGRLLFPLMFLADEGPPVHLATFLKLRQRDYYEALLDVQMKLNWSSWTRLFLECLIASCRHTQRLLQSVQDLADSWHARLGERRIRRHATIWRLVELLLGQPVVTVNSVATVLKVSYPAANAAVAGLIDMKVLRPKNPNRRNRAFHAVEMLALLYRGIDSVLDDVATLRDYGTIRSP